jgi:FkbM family methyltransferase
MNNRKNTNKLLKGNQVTVVDIGASGGIDKRWSMLTSCYLGILFEPDLREYSRLKKASPENLIVLNAALSDNPKKNDFHLCKKQGVSSLYFPNYKFLDKFPDSERFEIEKTVRLETDTLFNQLSNKNIESIDFIKLDVQGHELPILKGAGCYLNEAVGLEIEVEFEKMYVDQPLFNEVDAFVKDNGFELFDIKRYYWKRKSSNNSKSQKGQLIFGDALYFKSPELILSDGNITQEKVIRTICVYLAYGYADLAQTLLNMAQSSSLLDLYSYNSCCKIIDGHCTKSLVPDSRLRRAISSLFGKLSKVVRYKSYSFSDEKLGE